MLSRIQLSVALVTTSLLAQQSDWRVVQEVKPDTRVEVALRDGKRFAGRLVSSTEHSLTLDGGKVLPRGDIRQVHMREKGSRWRGAMFGGLTAFAIGFVVGASNAGYLTDRNNPPAGVRIGTGAGMGMFAAGVGAPIGGLAGGSSYKTVYHAEKRP